MNDSDLISVLIVEDDEDFQYLIRQTLEGETDMIPAGCCQTAEQALSLTEQAASRCGPHGSRPSPALLPTVSRLPGTSVFRPTRSSCCCLPMKILIP